MIDAARETGCIAGAIGSVSPVFWTKVEGTGQLMSKNDSPSPLLSVAPGQSAYSGPEAVTTLVLGGVSIRLVRPVDPDRLLDDPLVLDWNRRDDYMPYWAYLWPGAYLLAEAVASESWPEWSDELESPLALEIGCGLGLAGLVAVARGLRVQFTDYDQAPLKFVARSATENGFEPERFSMRRLDWRNLPDERFSIILGADVIYEARLVPLVAGLLAQLLTADGVGLIASPYRVAAEAFPSALAARGLTCSAQTATGYTEDGRFIEGTVYRVGRIPV
jgi:predicted nicotinamide N-methyase